MTIAVHDNVGNENVGQGNLKILLLILPGLAHNQDRFGNMLTSSAGQHELWTALIDLLDKGEIREAHLPRSVPASGKVQRVRLTGAKVVGKKLKFILMFGILALALDPVDFQKEVHRSACVAS